MQVVRLHYPFLRFHLACPTESVLTEEGEEGEEGKPREEEEGEERK